jgi:hypothetical protein
VLSPKVVPTLPGDVTVFSSAALPSRYMGAWTVEICYKDIRLGCPLRSPCGIQTPEHAQTYRHTDKPDIQTTRLPTIAAVSSPSRLPSDTDCYGKLWQL